jgi:hypothetical protein
LAVVGAGANRGGLCAEVAGVHEDIGLKFEVFAAAGYGESRLVQVKNLKKSKKREMAGI